MSRWFWTATKVQPAMVAEEEEKHLKDVEQALLLLLDDDIEGADAMLNAKNTAYHHVGRGISKFIASMLGAEKEMLNEAAALLYIAENKSWEYMKQAQKEPVALGRSVYPPGTEYLLCYSVAQLCSAMTVVLSGHVTEAIKAFYKLRKAFLTVEGIMMAEPKALKKQGGAMASQRGSQRNSRRTDMDSDDFYDAPSSPKSSRDTSPSGDDAIRHTPRLEPNTVNFDPNTVNFDPLTASNLLANYTDTFIYSGTRLCYGLLLLIFSMIQNPIFTKILAVVGFKGNRELSCKLLWQTTTFSNFNSAIAGILLQMYYNIMIFSDILPTDASADEDLSGYPKARCEALLVEMRGRYPNSKLWKLEEARMFASNRNLEAAVKILADNSKDASLKQLESITVFELAFHTAFMHDYQLCADTWIKCNELGTWSPTLYKYMTGCAYLELYRDVRDSDPQAAEQYRENAEEFFKQAPATAGKNKVMTKPLPFDVFCLKKIRIWESRAKLWKVDLVDAVGVSPITEMIYFWNGIKKMSPTYLSKSLSALSWTRTKHPSHLQSDLDETAIHTVLRASILRNLNRTSEARSILQDEILCHDRAKFAPDNWTLKNASYEMACLSWTEKDAEGQDERQKARECEKWLEGLQHGPDSFVLDTRLAFKIGISLMSVRWHLALIEEKGEVDVGKKVSEEVGGW